MYLPLVTCVCRALLLHACGRMCDVSINGVVHGVDNVWTILGRAEGYPARSGYTCSIVRTKLLESGISHLRMDMGAENREI